MINNACSGSTLPEDIPIFNTNGQYFDEDDMLDDRNYLGDIYDKNSNFFKYKEEFKQQINFNGTLYR